MEITKELAYLLGLITGRGSFEVSKKIIVLEFPYAKDLSGIPYCPKCDEILKGQEGKKTCPSHGIQNPNFQVGPFDQQTETEKSIRNVVLPILKKITTNDVLQTRVTGRTFLSVQFNEEQEIFDWIREQFSLSPDYYSFEIPQSVKDLELNLLKEYVSGVTDSASFPKWGNYNAYMHNEPAKDRARTFFQFVRNWKLPVQFCNLLQNQLNIRVDTIDWGHPNMRDGSRADYDKKGYTAFREHQLKIFAEHFDPSFHKFEYKRKILEELIEYNNSIAFQANEKCVPPKSVSVKVKHPSESDPLIPEEIRGEHFDSFWQICWKMGCSLCTNISNPEYAYLTGKDEKFTGSIDNIKNELDKKRQEKYVRASENRTPVVKKKKATTSDRLTESDTYAPLQMWLHDQLEQVNIGQKIISEIVATTTLSKLTSIQHIPRIVDLVEGLEIRPDVVGFVDDSEMTFIESKITTMTLANVGQLAGYCLIADPEFAYLISTRPISSSLQRILITNPELLSYHGKRIRIGQLDMETGQVTWVNI